METKYTSAENAEGCSAQNAVKQGLGMYAQNVTLVALNKAPSKTSLRRNQKMGLFSKLGGNSEISLTPQGGLLLAAISMTAIDGDIDDDEIAIIRRLDGSGKTDAWDSAVKAWKMKSVEECILLAATSMNSEQQLIAIANLIDIAMANGVLAGDEQRLLEAYVEAFDVSESDIETIVNVIAIKNNKSSFR